MKYAPIAFLAYKRPEHTKQSLESLSHNNGAESSQLFIFCDGAKHPEDQEAVNQVRKVVKSKQWCSVTHIIEREKNLGLANSIIQGVTDLCNKYGRVIVIEDDLILSPYFLQYMNTALDCYADESRVMQVSGHMFPVELKAENDAIFLPFTTSWGWSTWQRSWKCFDPEMSDYEALKRNKKLRYEFDLNGSYPYFSMLEAQRKGEINSWAIRWYLSVFMKQGLTLFPVRSLVHNIGFDGSGTHCGVTQDNLIIDFNNNLHQKVESFPAIIAVNSQVTKTIFKSIYNRQSSIKYLSSTLKSYLKKFLCSFKNL